MLIGRGSAHQGAFAQMELHGDVEVEIPAQQHRARDEKHLTVGRGDAGAAGGAILGLVPQARQPPAVGADRPHHLPVQGVVVEPEGAVAEFVVAPV